MNWFSNLGRSSNSGGSAPATEGAGNSGANASVMQSSTVATGTTNNNIPATPAATAPTPEDNLRGFNEIIMKGAEALKKNTSEATKSVYAHLTQESIDGALANASFSSKVKPEVFASIVGPNNPEGAQALMGVLDIMYRQVLSTAATGAMRLSEFGLNETMKQFKDGELPGLIGNTLTRNQLQETNPLASNPLFQPAIEAAIAGLKAQHPTVPHAEIVQHVNNMFKSLANTAAPGAQQPQGNQQTGIQNVLAKPVTDFNDDFFAQLGRG